MVTSATQALRAAQKAVAAERRQALAEPFPVPRSPRQGERLIVTTQTCDIIKDAESFPQVEVARVFSTTNVPTIIESQNLGSARYFRLNPIGESPAVILDFRWRTFLDKGFLVEHDPDDSIVALWALDRRRVFARWLGRRYSRAVLSDEDAEQIAQPVRDRWARLIAEEPTAARRYSDEYAEFRFRREEDGTLTVFLLSPDPDPSGETALEIAAILAEVIEPLHGEVNFPGDRRSYHTFTLAEQLTTEQIDLEWASYGEEELSGALPAE